MSSRVSRVFCCGYPLSCVLLLGAQVMMGLAMVVFYVLALTGVFA